MKKTSLLILFAIQCLCVFSQIPSYHKVFNFTVFSEDKKVETPLLDAKSSDKAKQHPEYGIQPYDAGCRECVELIDKRSEHSRQFIDPVRGTHSWSQQSYFPLHYQNTRGQWMTIDPRLRPEPGQAGVFCAHRQPVPVKFNLAEGYTSLDLHSFEMKYNKGLKMYYLEDTNMAPVASTAADFSHYTAGDDGARVFNIWPGIDMEAFAQKGGIETNFIISAKPEMPVSKGYLVIEDHLDLPEGFTLTRSNGGAGRSKNDLLVKNRRGDEIARFGTVCMRNASFRGLATEYVVLQKGNSYTIKMLVPYAFLDEAASDYPLVVDPIVTGGGDTVSGIVDTGNYISTGLIGTYAYLAYTSLPGHCDYHMTDTVPGHSTLLSTSLEIEFKTSIPGQFDGGRGCHDTLAADHAAFAHVCLEKEISMVLQSDHCLDTNGLPQTVSIGYDKQIVYECPNHDCDTPGIVTTDPATVPGAAPVPLPYYMIACYQPQCADYFIPFTLENSDSICEDQCGNLGAYGTKWEITIEACTLDATLSASDTITCASHADTLTCHPSCGVPPYRYRWSTGDTTQSIVVYPLTDELIDCTVYDACNDSNSSLRPIAISVYGAPVTFSQTDTMWNIASMPAPALTGGSPAGGTYSGPFVTADSILNVVLGVNADTVFPVTYSYTDSLNGCMGSATQLFMANRTSGISALNGQTSIRLYPNPNNGYFTLATDHPLPAMIYTIYDMLGQVIAQQAIKSDNQTIDLSGASEGVYTLVVQGAPPLRFVIMR